VRDPSSALVVLLLLAALAVVVVAAAVLAWRLRRARDTVAEQRAIADQQRVIAYQQGQIARANLAAAGREEVRQVAAHQRAVRAIAGERDAQELLASAGYEVLARQVEGSWTIRANGEPKTFGLRADYLVARDRRRFIAEVKTGRLAPSLAHAGTRRQLLEYGAAFDVDGVLLVDADRGTITHVEIDAFAARRAPQPIPQQPLPAVGPPTPIARAGLTPRAVLVIAAVSFGAGVLVGVAMAR
jgi:hypothetical protein